jgi:hypothetical protein
VRSSRAEAENKQVGEEAFQAHKEGKGAPEQGVFSAPDVEQERAPKA